MYIGVKYKYFLLYLLTILPVILIDTIIYNQLSERLKDKIMEQNMEIVKQANNVLTILQDFTVETNQSTEEYTEIISFLVNSILGKGSEIMVIDNQRNLVYTTSTHLVTKGLHTSVFTSDRSEGWFHVNYLNIERILVYSYNPVNKWYLMILTPTDTAIDDKNSYIRQLMTLLIVTSVVSVVFLIFLISIRVTSPISSLRKRLEQLEKGEFNIDQNRKVLIRDDMWQIGISFNKIVSQLKQHVHREFEYKMKADEAKFLALQSQINPHFLHNTLETINSIAMLEKVPLISEISRSLSKMFRYNTVNEGIYVKVKDELDHLENYLTVQLIRFDGSIERRYQVDETLLDRKITKFVLQPIVENCFTHAFRDMDRGGVISISVQREHEGIAIRIADNGAGMDDRAIVEMNCAMCSVDVSKTHEQTINRASIGLYNVNTRLKMCFGEQYGIKIERNTPSGLIVTIHLPDEGDYNV